MGHGGDHDEGRAARRIPRRRTGLARAAPHPAPAVPAPRARRRRRGRQAHPAAGHAALRPAAGAHLPAQGLRPGVRVHLGLRSGGRPGGRVAVRQTRGAGGGQPAAGRRGRPVHGVQPRTQLAAGARRPGPRLQPGGHGGLPLNDAGRGRAAHRPLGPRTHRGAAGRRARRHDQADPGDDRPDRLRARLRFLRTRPAAPLRDGDGRHPHLRPAPEQRALPPVAAPGRPAQRGRHRLPQPHGGRPRPGPACGERRRGR